MQFISKLRRAGLVAGTVAVCVTLASCGGSDDGTPPTAAASPTLSSAAASVTGFIAYLKVVVMTMPDNTTPIDVSAFVAPTDDTAAFDPSI